MENSYRKHGVKSPSTEFSDEFVDIVNEINDFISVLEVRQKELAAGTPRSERAGSPRQGSIERLSALDMYKGDSGAEYLSDSRTESSYGPDSRFNSKCLDFQSDSQSNSRASSLSDFGEWCLSISAVLNENTSIENLKGKSTFQKFIHIFLIGPYFDIGDTSFTLYRKAKTNQI